MKILFVFLFTLFLLGFSSAIASLDIDNMNPQPNEMIIGKLSTPGEFVGEITEDDITFLEGRREVQPEFQLYQYDGDYYFYVNFKTEGNYTLQTTELLTNSGLGVVGTVIEVNLTVVYIDNESKSILSVRPGVYYSLDEPSIEIVNMGDINLDVTFLSKTVSLVPAESYEINFLPQNVLSTLKIESYKTFNVPVIYLLAEGEAGTPGSVLGSLKSVESDVEIVLNHSELMDYNFEIINTGDLRVSDISITDVSGYFSYNFTSFLLPRSGQNVSMTLVTSEVGVYTDDVIINYTEGNDSFSFSVPFSVFVLPENKTLDEVLVTEETCDVKGGIFCEGDLKCSGDSSFTSGGVCCLGECVDLGDDKGSDSKGGSGWILGLLIVVLIGAALYYFYSKYKKSKPLSAKSDMKKVAEKYETRLKGRPEGKVQGSLEK